LLSSPTPAKRQAHSSLMGRGVMQKVPFEDFEAAQSKHLIIVENWQSHRDGETFIHTGADSSDLLKMYGRWRG